MICSGALVGVMTLNPAATARFSFVSSLAQPTANATSAITARHFNVFFICFIWLFYGFLLLLVLGFYREVVQTSLGWLAATLQSSLCAHFMIEGIPSCRIGHAGWPLVRVSSAPPPAAIPTTTAPGAPIHRRHLVHLRGFQVLITQVLGQTELLIGLIFFGPTNIGLVIRRVRQDVIWLTFVVDRRYLSRRGLREDGLMLRSFRRDDFEAGGDGQVLFF